MTDQNDEDQVRDLLGRGRSSLRLPPFTAVARRAEQVRPSPWWLLGGPVLIALAVLIGSNLAERRDQGQAGGWTTAASPSPSPRALPTPTSCGATPALGSLPSGLAPVDARRMPGVSSSRYEGNAISLVVTVSWSPVDPPAPLTEVRQVGARTVSFYRGTGGSGGEALMASWREEDLLCPYVSIAAAWTAANGMSADELSRIVLSIPLVDASLRKATPSPTRGP
jgi:hypothetical protein